MLQVQAIFVTEYIGVSWLVNVIVSDSLVFLPLPFGIRHKFVLTLMHYHKFHLFCKFSNLCYTNLFVWTLAWSIFCIFMFNDVVHGLVSECCVHIKHLRLQKVILFVKNLYMFDIFRTGIVLWLQNHQFEHTKVKWLAVHAWLSLF